ncbi:hypothetical protein [Enterovirga sp. CN4-39]|uniref:hypothetical protein n=1 Tax=Enterovirga sp. CN4-39 TaxID=3400910 RepID=UPI003C05B1EF
MLPLREIDILGVLVAPFALCVPIALLLTFASLMALRRIPAAAAWTRAPSSELSLLVGLLSGLVLLLGRF